MCIKNSKEEDTQSLEQKEKKLEKQIDRELQNTFPASDPPGWTLGVSEEECYFVEDTDCQESYTKTSEEVKK